MVRCDRAGYGLRADGKSCSFCFCCFLIRDIENEKESPRENNTMSCCPCFGNFMPIVSSRRAHRRRCEELRRLEEQLQQSNEKLDETVGFGSATVYPSPSPISPLHNYHHLTISISTSNNKTIA